MGLINRNWACFSCRKFYKSPHGEVRREAANCPQCRAPLNNMGLDFRAPRQTDVEQWRKVELLFQNGINFSSCGCGGPGFRPARLREVPNFLAQRERNLAHWQRQSRIEERAAQLQSRRKQKRAHNQARRMARLFGE